MQRSPGPLFCSRQLGSGGRNNCVVTADGNPRTYHGTIGFISPSAEFTPKTVQTEDLRTELVYRLRVIVNDPDDALRQGQPVTVRVPASRSAASRP